jgi:hypothetical protein
MEGVHHGFGISPYMQEWMTYAGHLKCYVRSHEILEQFLSIEMSPSQVYRVTDHVSESLKGEDELTERTLPPVSQTDVLYVEIDGSIICTRNRESWKEIKPARLFRGNDCLNPNSELSYLTNSQYVGYFGNSVDFGEKLQKVTDSYGELKDRLIFLTDGAAWIREWIADHYPLSRSILDFFHVMEHLYQFADHAFPDAPSAKAQWCERQKRLLAGFAGRNGYWQNNLRQGRRERQKAVNRLLSKQ